MRSSSRSRAKPVVAAVPDARRRPPSSQVGLYLLLLAMSTSSMMRTSSNALVPHTDGLGDGYSAFDYGSHLPELDHLASTMELRDQLSDPATPRRRVMHVVEGQPENESPEVEAIHEDDIFATEDSAEFDEDAMEIADDSDVVEAPIQGSFTSVLSTSDDILHSARHRVYDLEPTLIATIFQFLSIPDLSRARSAYASFETAASWLAPRPFADSSLTFVRCSWLAALPDPIPRPRALPVAFRWRCLNCSEYSTFHEQCTVCGCNVRQSAARVFVGQLRKRHSAVALQHMINLLCPEVKVLHIESHSNREGFEKGAAWLYVDTPEDALTMLNLHKRVFFDADESGDEGFWFIEDNGTSDAECEGRKAHLFEFALQRKADENRKRMCLPGQPLVVELPQTSMLSGYQPMPLHATSVRQTAVTRNALGWYHTGTM